MNKTGQGVLQQGKLIHLLICILLLLTFCLAHPASAETPTADSLQHKINTQKHRVFIIYSPNNTLHSNIADELSDNLSLRRSDVIISKNAPEEKFITAGKSTDIIISIGDTSRRSLDKRYPNTYKLYISTDPNERKPGTTKKKSDALLYMTQSYCRQIRFVKLLNTQWKTISILNSQKKPIDITTIQQCANKHDMKIYSVSMAADESLTNKLKHALQHSDVLLALPDSNIYNSKTVKNILLTSYRYRKPVIAFSNNFVNAGALASIYSDIAQISNSAATLTEQYLENNYHFIKSVNYPLSFNISVNKQVFKALNLKTPDISRIKQILENSEPDNQRQQP